VRVCGYGGERIADILSKANYIDDLPVVPTVRTDNGSIVFYGVGPETWNASVIGRYVRESNDYTTEGYYFITEAEDDSTLIAPQIEKRGRPTAQKPAEDFWMRLHHETDLVSPGEAGPKLVGEEFRLTPKRNFIFELTDRVDNDDTGVWFECSFVAKVINKTSQLSFTANGSAVPEKSTDIVSSTPNDEHYHGTECITRHVLENFTDDKLTLGIDYSAPATVQGAWLNYLSVNYRRKLRMPDSKYLMFWTNSPGLTLSDATEKTRIYDVTTPGQLIEIDASAVAEGKRTWTSSSTGWRTYVAFDDDAKLPAPTFVANIANQDLHSALVTKVPDMIIVCNAPMMAQARRIAELHAKDPIDSLHVEVYDLAKVYNEFSSGTPDASGIRKFFKMAYDLGKSDAPAGYDSRLRYALIIGRATYDNRHLTDGVRNFAPYTVPNWTGGTMRNSLNDTDGYTTDDFLAMLDDNSGKDKGLDDLSIALGRIPARTPAEASNYIDKLEQYMFSSKKTEWKNRVMMLADDGDSGTHMNQSEKQIANMAGIVDNPFFVNKVYIDAYLKTSGQYPEGREAMFRLLNDGVVWWNYIGHANDHSLTHDGQLTFNDINGLFLKHVPVFYAATCDFLKWDQNSLSGGEILFYERYGGVISVISATRPVYIYENGLLNNAMGRQLGSRDVSGHLLTVGEIYRRAKNNILTDKGEKRSNYNRLKFVLMGDPAMRLATPDNLIELTEIGGTPLVSLDDTDTPVELHALQTATANGFIKNLDGSKKTDFNGVVTLTLYDAEFSTTTHGYPSGNSEGKPVTFEQQGPRIFAGSAPVVNGEFAINITVPSDITDNYRPAAINLYAYSTDNADEAAGVTRDLYVYGFDDSADTDANAPTIESLYLNHESFVNGDVTNNSPMLIAHISDDVALNLSTAGIGHAMSIQLDGNKTFNDVSQYFTPSVDGTPSGVINYPLENISAGDHSLVLRIWDASANSATATVDFTVADKIAPRIFDIYTDASPATDRANFFISHDRPDQMLTVTVTVYNLLGHPLWNRTVTGVSDMFTSTPVTWDLTDSAGRRVPRGIYLYRATITADGETHDTGSRRIAVAAQ